MRARAAGPRPRYDCGLGGVLVRLDRPALALVLATWGLLVVGASVRVNGAGLACPDWPLCFGQVVPRIDLEVGFEFGHRVLAGIVSLGFMALAVGVVRGRARYGRGAVGLVVAAAVALAVQIVLGGLTVLHLLAEWTVASHLLTGNTFCVLLLLLALTLRERSVPVARPAVAPGLRWLAAAVGALVPLQLALGGYVAGASAGLACGTWPGCNGPAWFPTFEGLVGLQVTHRLLAYLLSAAALLLVLASRGERRLFPASLVLLAAVLVQATIGVANVLLRLPVEVTLLHTAGAAAVFLSAALANWEAWRAPVHAAYGGTLAVEAS